MHHGTFPIDWVKPGGDKSDIYCETCKEMQSSKNVLEKGKLRQPKCTREEHLCECCVNLDNHIKTHKCSSGYYIKKAVKNQKYDPQKHGDAAEEDIREDARGVRRVTMTLEECQMLKTKLLNFDHSGENNLTGGVPPLLEPMLIFDLNSQLKFVPRQNHPRLVGEPLSFYSFGANNDTKSLLINATGEATLRDMGKDEYDHFTRNLLAAGKGGLEHFSRAHVCEEYITSYNCKGGESSHNWEVTSHAVTEEFCSREQNQDKTVRSLLGKHMNEVTCGMSITQDQAQYVLGGGMLKQNSYGSPLKCSVTQIDISNIGNMEGESKSFNWKNILRRYKDWPEALESCNVYQFCSRHWKSTSGKPRPIQFFGYNNTPKWPVTESCAKWMLTFYKP